MKILEMIEEAVAKHKKPKKILINYKTFVQLQKEENLYTLFCTKCGRFLPPNFHHSTCPYCYSSNHLVEKDLPIQTILDLPFEVSSLIDENEKIRVI